MNLTMLYPYRIEKETKGIEIAFKVNRKKDCKLFPTAKRNNEPPFFFLNLSVNGN